MFKRKILSEVNFSDILKMHNEGMSQHKIAVAIGCSQSSVARLLKSAHIETETPRTKSWTPAPTTFGEKCAEAIAKQNGTPYESPRYNTVALKIVSKKTHLEGKVCNYTVDTVSKKATLQQRAMTGAFELNREELNTFIEELKILQAHLAE